MKKRKIGLFFGSFNPVHNGHLILANYIVEYTDLDSLWFVVSPQNPFKDESSLLQDRHRFDMLKLAVKDDTRFEVCDIEFDMPKPSYTIDTLKKLSQLHLDVDFYLICGMDNLAGFSKWKNAQEILDNYHLMVYPRKNYEGGDLVSHKSVHIIDAPEIEISSTFIRKAVAENKVPAILLYFPPGFSVPKLLF